MFEAVRPLVEIVRDDTIESLHVGTLVVLGPQGDIAHSVGDPRVKVFGRSVWKPIQAAAMVDLGAALDPESLAVVAGSHSGLGIHQTYVKRVLSLAGLSERHLRNTPGAPFGGALQPVGSGEVSRLAANCSGKHAGMLLATQRNGWRIDTYLEADHPVQAAVLTRAKLLGAESVSFAGPDGCGAPALTSTLLDLARVFRGLALAADDASSRVCEAMVRHPDLVGGPGRYATRVMTARTDIVAKDGAEGVFALASRNGLSAAFKVADGSTRPWSPILTALIGADMSLPDAPCMQLAPEVALGSKGVSL